MPKTIRLRDLVTAPFRFPRLAQIQELDARSPLRVAPHAAASSERSSRGNPATTCFRRARSRSCSTSRSSAPTIAARTTRRSTTCTSSKASRRICDRDRGASSSSRRRSSRSGRTARASRGVRTTRGETFTAARYVSNVDPRRTAGLLGARRWARDLSYEYSSGNITLYLGVRDIDLRDYGFGSYNVWHYPHDDIDSIYERQRVARDFREPWLFMSTPDAPHDAPGLCPEGHQILELATSADHAWFKALRDRDRRAYNAEKKRLARARCSPSSSATTCPRLREHLAIQVMGTPATNERFCAAPFGNAYGSALTPKNVSRRVPTRDAVLETCGSSTRRRAFRASAAR